MPFNIMTSCLKHTRVISACRSQHTPVTLAYIPNLQIPVSFITPITSWISNLNLNLKMADRHRQHQQQQAIRRNPITTFLSNLQTHSPNSTQMLGILTLIITVAILLMLAGITLTTTVLGLIVFSPIILISSPVWIPLAICTIITIGSILGVCGIGLGMVAGGSWMYKYFKGMNPPGAGRVDYARSRIVDTASHVKDYAKEYGGYLQSKVKDAAPGA